MRWFFPAILNHYQVRLISDFDRVSIQNSIKFVK